MTSHLALEKITYFLKNKPDIFWSIWKVFYNFLESLDGDSFVELMDIETIYKPMLSLFFFFCTFSSLFFLFPFFIVVVMENGIVVQTCVTIFDK